MGSSSKARQRIDSLLDPNSFVEIGALVKARSTDFNPEPKGEEADGVVTGYGVLDGRLVYVYSQDPSSLNGSIGEMHARKIIRLYDLALKMGAPLIGLIDSSGMRLTEATDALNAFGELYAKQAAASGVIPQITAVFGDCGGGLAIAAALSDFTFVEAGAGRIFVNGPNEIADNRKEKCDTAAPAFQSEKAGTVDCIADEASLYTAMRTLVSLLPSNNEDDDSFAECTDDLNRLVPDFLNGAEDPAVSIPMLSDNGVFFETKQAFAPEMVTGFIRLNGSTVGVVANREKCYDAEGQVAATFEARLTERGCIKAAEHVSFCDAFGIPVLSLTNVEGYASTMCEERRIASNAAKLVYAFANATVPKVNLITKRAYSSAYCVMNSSAIGADISVCFADTKIGAMEADLAAKILCADGSAEDRAEAAKTYDDLQNGAASAAGRGIVDEIIEPADTRKYIIGAFEMLFTKRDSRPMKKHGTV